MLHRESVLGNYSRPIRIEDVDEAVADTRLIVLVVRRLLLRERHPQLPIDVLDPNFAPPFVAMARPLYTASFGDRSATI
jgi:hypothetical protein